MFVPYHLWECTSTRNLSRMYARIVKMRVACPRPVPSRGVRQTSTGEWLWAAAVAFIVTRADVERRMGQREVCGQLVFVHALPLKLLVSLHRARTGSRSTGALVTRTGAIMCNTRELFFVGCCTPLRCCRIRKLFAYGESNEWRLLESEKIVFTSEHAAPPTTGIKQTTKSKLFFERQSTTSVSFYCNISVLRLRNDVICFFYFMKSSVCTLCISYRTGAHETALSRGIHSILNGKRQVWRKLSNEITIAAAFTLLPKHASVQDDQ